MPWTRNRLFVLATASLFGAPLLGLGVGAAADALDLPGSADLPFVVMIAGIGAAHTVVFRGLWRLPSRSATDKLLVTSGTLMVLCPLILLGWALAAWR